MPDVITQLGTVLWILIAVIFIIVAAIIILSLLLIVGSVVISLVFVVVRLLIERRRMNKATKIRLHRAIAADEKRREAESVPVVQESSE